MNVVKIRENRLTASSNCMRKAKSSTSQHTIHPKHFLSDLHNEAGCSGC